jgi:phospholipase/carboxylesterase
MSGEPKYIVRAATSVLTEPGHKGEPAGAIVLFHGRGADELDLLPLLDELDPGTRLAGVSVRAPLQIVPGGYYWYIVREVGRPDPPTFATTYDTMSAWLDERLPELTGVGLDRTVFCGFSQGTAMAYAFALGRGRPSPAALIAFSGFIPEVPGVFDLDLEGHRDVPVALGHGALDPIIPVTFGRAAAERLDAAGYDVTYRESPMLTHGIDPGTLRDVASWLSPRIAALQRAA